MAPTNQGLEKMLVELLEVKSKHNFDTDNFLLLLGMVNLMQIVNLLDERAKNPQQGSGATRRTTAGPDLVPMMGMFGHQRSRSSS